ncbi:DNA-protecting protein DprA [Clostridiales bacterium COT073_COT-073]|nr:DNA-protecting protein DprA [Clostridiales bacterium COT073_COT-073]
MQNELYWLWLLSIRGLGAVKQNILLREWGTAGQLYHETAERIEQFMKKEKIFQAKDFQEFCRSKQDMGKCRQELNLLRAQGVEIISREQADYPSRLTEMIDGPPVVFAKGNWQTSKINSGPVLAVVGTRRITAYGREVAATIGKFCAEFGITLVSGMAAGVDGTAQRSCLKHGGYSIGVLASGLAHQFPAGNRDLYLDMEKQGVLISEEWYQTPPLANLFPKRNRIISGLAEAVIVVEAADKSGSLITADYALEQGRDIYAVPGRIGDRQSVGCNHLIGQGAYILENIEKFFADLSGGSQRTKPCQKNLAENLEPVEKILYQQIGTEPVYIGRLLEYTGLEQGEVQLCLLQLEWKGYIEQISAGYYVALPQIEQVPFPKSKP